MIRFDVKTLVANAVPDKSDLAHWQITTEQLLHPLFRWVSSAIPSCCLSVFGGCHLIGWLAATLRSLTIVTGLNL